jgi:hypothetical protein
MEQRRFLSLIVFINWITYKINLEDFTLSICDAIYSKLLLFLLAWKSSRNQEIGVQADRLFLLQWCPTA